MIYMAGKEAKDQVQYNEDEDKQGLALHNISMQVSLLLLLLTTISWIDKGLSTYLTFTEQNIFKSFESMQMKMT